MAIIAELSSVAGSLGQRHFFIALFEVNSKSGIVESEAGVMVRICCLDRFGSWARSSAG